MNATNRFISVGDSVIMHVSGRKGYETGFERVETGRHKGVKRSKEVCTAGTRRPRRQQFMYGPERLWKCLQLVCITNIAGERNTAGRSRPGHTPTTVRMSRFTEPPSFLHRDYSSPVPGSQCWVPRCLPMPRPAAAAPPSPCLQPGSRVRQPKKVALTSRAPERAAGQCRTRRRQSKRMVLFPPAFLRFSPQPSERFSNFSILCLASCINIPTNLPTPPPCRPPQPPPGLPTLPAHPIPPSRQTPAPFANPLPSPINAIPPYAYAGVAQVVTTTPHHLPAPGTSRRGNRSPHDVLPPGTEAAARTCRLNPWSPCCYTLHAPHCAPSCAHPPLQHPPPVFAQDNAVLAHLRRT